MSPDALNAVSRSTQFCKKNHLQKYAEQSRATGRFTDIRIKSGNISLQVHRIVLACYSQFFERLFQTPMLERKHGTVELNNLDGTSVKALVDFMYSKTIEIDQENVFHLLASAHFLQIDDVCESCFSYLKTVINTNNWTKILSILSLYENDSLLEHLHQFISENFDRISPTENFKNLARKDLTAVMQHLNRSIVKEHVVYDSIIIWILHDEENRRSALQDLLVLIDLHKLRYDFLRDSVAINFLIKENLRCLDAVMTVLKFRHKNMRLRENGRNLLSIGGYYTQSNVNEVYNCQEKPGFQYPDLPTHFCHSKALELDTCIYNIGGSIDSGFKKVANEVYRLNLKEQERKWIKIRPMNEGRCSMGAAVFRNCLVVAGGVSCGGRLLSRVEAFDPTLNKWKQVSDMNYRRSAAELVACDDSLYALGGHDGEEYLSSTEKIRDFEGIWEIAEPMSFSRALFAAASCNGEIYAFGGSCRDQYGTLIKLSSAEKYSPIDKKWVKITSLNIPRHMQSAGCMLGGKILVVGGEDDNGEIIKSLDCYDTETDSWSITGVTTHSLVRHSLVAFSLL